MLGEAEVPIGSWVRRCRAGGVEEGEEEGAGGRGTTMGGRDGTVSSGERKS